VAEYDQRVVWILRQAGLTPAQLKQQYVGYEDQRAAFEAGYGTVDDVTARITPGVAGMLDLEDRMLADFTAARRVATAGTPTRFHWSTWTIVSCVLAFSVLVGVLVGVFTGA